MNIYFCGSMTNSQEKMNDYKILIDYLDNFGNVLNKFVGESIKEISPIDCYNRDTSNLKKANILIADVTIASTGVGYELGSAEYLKIKSLVIYDANCKVPSVLIIGNPNYVVKSYKNIEEAKEIIKSFVESCR